MYSLGLSYIPALVHGLFCIQFPIPKMTSQSTSFLHLYPHNRTHIYLVCSITAIKKANTQTLYDKLNTTTSLVICFSFCSVYSKKENTQTCFPLRRDKIKRVFKTHTVTRPLKGSKDVLLPPLEDQVSDNEVRRGTGSGVSLMAFPTLLVATVDKQTHLFNIFHSEEL